MIGVQNGVKRALDCVVSLTALILLSPLIILVAILVRSRLGSPVLFRQPRPGFRGQCFDLLKFRSMTDARDSQGILLPDADRLTGFGRFLRSTSLDELPALLNVLRGDMSLVGPRPLLVRYLPLYSEAQARRHDVRPGITGWAQVCGRNSLSWEEKFALDLWYISRRSLWLDLRIIWKTLALVLSRRDVNAEGEATMGEFRGSGTTPLPKVDFQSGMIER